MTGNSSTEEWDNIPFGPQKVHTRKRSECSPFTPPPQLQRIKRGGYSEYVGFLINDGYACWEGFDLDTGEIVRVERYAGPQLASGLSEIFGLEILKGLKTFRISLKFWTQPLSIEIITKKHIKKERLTELIFLANELWSSGERYLIMAADVHNALILVDGDEGKIFGGPGILEGSADQVKTMLQVLFS